jgi:hypothetical protein
VASDPAPEPRWGHTATWVPDIGLVVWSGQDEDGFFGDVWRYDPSTNEWQELPSSGAVPEPRYGSCASLGPDERLWISHGFTNDGRFSDTRAYDFATGEWTDMTPSGQVPIERCLHDCYWNADGSQLILYGGQTNGVPALGDAWAYDLATGDWTATTEGEAPARQLYALAPTDDRALIFGGGALDGGFLDDAWELDAATLTLTPLDVPAGPSGRAGATLIVDVERGRLLLFGGQGADGQLADVWEIGLP